MSFFWRLPPANDEFEDIPYPDDEQEEKRLKEAAAKMPGALALAAAQEASEPPVQWPPMKPLPPAETGKSTSSRSRGGRSRGGKASSEKSGPAPPAKDDEKSESKAHEDGWLPRSEYEAKKREERAQRQREREKAAANSGTSAGGKGSGKGNQKSGATAAATSGKGGQRGPKEGSGRTAKDGSLRGSKDVSSGGVEQPASATDGQGRRSRGQGSRGSRNWEDLPPRPPAVEESEAVKAKQLEEEKKIKARDRLRNANSIDEMQAAISEAKELGLVEEVKLGERKLAKLQSA
jgi:hypothetical protein